MRSALSARMIAANGKSGFLGALAAGFLAGYIILLLKKVCDKLPESLEKLAPVLFYPDIRYPDYGRRNELRDRTCHGEAINTALNSGLANMSGSSKILLGLILGGMMSVDMGEPVQQSGICIWNRFDCGRQLRYYGSSYDRRNGSSLCNRPCYLTF